jgi:hypothetical protein
VFTKIRLNFVFHFSVGVVRFHDAKGNSQEAPKYWPGSLRKKEQVAIRTLPRPNKGYPKAPGRKQRRLPKKASRKIVQDETFQNRLLRLTQKEGH